MRRLSLPLAITLLAACSDGDRPPDGSDGGVAAPPDAGPACAPGQLALEDGSCRPAGVEPANCAEGFTAADHGCDPILPAAPCEPGMMAVPGDTACREIMPCGTGAWGDIPVGDDTQYVDGAYGGGDSDGTVDKPWTTISHGVAAAAPGATVAIAAGSYLEDVTIAGAPVRLRGRCPALVEIVGQQAAYAAVVIWAQGTEVGGLAMRGPGGGVASAALDVKLDHLWVHDTEDYYGLGAQADNGPTALVLSDSLIEGAYETAVAALGGVVTIERCLIRDPGGGEGLGLRALPHPVNDLVASVAIHTSLLERNRFFGAYAAGSHLHLEATVIRDTEVNQQGAYGVGAQIRDDPLTGVPGSGTITRSVLSGNRTAGLVVADGQVSMESSVIRDTRSDTQGQVHGRAIQVITDLPAGPPAAFSLQSSLLEGNREVGLVVVGAAATVEATIVRDMLPIEADGTHGRGISVQVHADNGRRSTGTIAATVVERCHTSGIAVFASDVTIRDTVVRDTAPQLANDFFGRGITVQINPATGEQAFATLSGVLVERTDDVGISIVGSDAIVEHTIVRDTAARLADGQFGDGIVVDGTDGQPASLELRGSQVTGSQRAGVGNFAAFAKLVDNRFECNTVHLNGEHLDGAFEFQVEGVNTCSCADNTTTCKVLSTNLEPPDIPGM